MVYETLRLSLTFYRNSRLHAGIKKRPSRKNIVPNRRADRQEGTPRLVCLHQIRSGTTLERTGNALTEATDSSQDAPTGVGVAASSRKPRAAAAAADPLSPRCEALSMSLSGSGSKPSTHRVPSRGGSAAGSSLPDCGLDVWERQPRSSDSSSCCNSSSSSTSNSSSNRWKATSAAAAAAASPVGLKARGRSCSQDASSRGGVCSSSSSAIACCDCCGSSSCCNSTSCPDSSSGGSPRRSARVVRRRPSLPADAAPCEKGSESSSFATPADSHAAGPAASASSSKCSKPGGLAATDCGGPFAAAAAVEDADTCSSVGSPVYEPPTGYVAWHLQQQPAAAAAPPTATGAVGRKSPACVAAAAFAAAAAAEEAAAATARGRHVVPSRRHAAAAAAASGGPAAAAAPGESSNQGIRLLLRRLSSGGDRVDPVSLASFATSALGSVASWAHQVGSKGTVLLHSSSKAAAAAPRKLVAVASAAASAAASVVASEQSEWTDRSRCSSRCSRSSGCCSSSCSRSRSSSNERISSIAHDWVDEVSTMKLPAVSSLDSCASSSSSIGAAVAAAAAAAACRVSGVTVPCFAAAADHGASRPTFGSSASFEKQHQQQQQLHAEFGGAEEEESAVALGLQLPPSPRTLRKQEADDARRGSSNSSSSSSSSSAAAANQPADKRPQFAVVVPGAGRSADGSTLQQQQQQQQQQQRSLVEVLPVISSPSYAFLDARTLGDLLALPSPNESTLREDLLLHQNLLLFCRSTEPLEVSLLVPLASVASAWSVDGRGRVSAAPATTGRGRYRLKLLAAAGAAAKAAELGKNNAKQFRASKTILIGLEKEEQRDVLLKHILYLADKWRSRPAVPDFLYRPPYQQQLVLLRKQLHTAARNLLLSQLAVFVKEALRQRARDFLLRLRSAATAAAAARDHRSSCVTRGSVLLQQWMRLHNRQDEALGLQRLRMHALEQQQQQQAAAVVTALASGHLQLASHRAALARQRLDYVCSRLLRQRLHAGLMRLLVFGSSVAQRDKAKQTCMQHLSQALWKPQRRLLQAAFMRMRKASLQRQLQQNALLQLLHRLRQRRLKAAWQQLLLHACNRKAAGHAAAREAFVLLSHQVHARMRTGFRCLQSHTAAAAARDKLQVCSNLQKQQQQQQQQQRAHQQQSTGSVRALCEMRVIAYSGERALGPLYAADTPTAGHDAFGAAAAAAAAAASVVGIVLLESRLAEAAAASARCCAAAAAAAKRTDAAAARSLGLPVEPRPRFRMLRAGFMKMQQMQAAGRTMRCFLRAQLLLQLVSRLQLQLIKQQAVGFSALRAHAATQATYRSVAAAKLAAELQEREAAANCCKVEPPSFGISASAAAAASERLQQLLDQSAELLDKQHHSMLSGGDEKPSLLYLPQPFAAQQAAAAAAAAAAATAGRDRYGLHAYPSLLSQETSDGEDGCFLPSSGQQPTLLQLSRSYNSPTVSTGHAVDEGFDWEVPPKQQTTRLAYQPAAVPLNSHGSASSSKNDTTNYNWYEEPRLHEDTESFYAAREAELDALLGRLQPLTAAIPQPAKHPAASPLPQTQSKSCVTPTRGFASPAGVAVHAVPVRQQQQHQHMQQHQQKWQQQQQHHWQQQQKQWQQQQQHQWQQQHHPWQQQQPLQQQHVWHQQQNIYGPAHADFHALRVSTPFYSSCPTVLETSSGHISKAVEPYNLSSAPVALPPS
ncbi:hypothetical protein ACSSS7_000938 [Eimeria intestinalis]